MTITTKAENKMINLTDVLRDDRRYLSELESYQVEIIRVVASDPKARKELIENRAEIASIRSRHRKLEAQLDAALERPIKTTTQS